MARALKLMTWNVQQLSAPFAPGDPEARATQVGRAILDLPAREQPDVVAFNEVFNEDGRRRLLTMLKVDYPHFIKKLEHPGLDLEEDSGLMLFSKLPFLPLPTGGTVFYQPFPKAAGPDALAAKGVGIVRVAGPFDPTTIAFTHTQASYDAANTEHSQIRADQFAFIRQMLVKVASGNLQDYANSVIAGDLNVKGDPDDTTGEFNTVFSGIPNTFGGDFDDGWRVSMHPPNDLTDYDPGYTQRDTPSLTPNRFDYQCVRLDANVDIGLVAHRLWTPLRLASGVSDHWALQGHLHRLGPHCSPATAMDLLKTTPANAGSVGSKVWSLSTDFRDEDMYHWVYIASAGTYSVFMTPDIEVTAFRRTDFTNELAPTDVLSVSQLPPPVQAALQGPDARHGSTFGQGVVVSWREPFFLRIRGTVPSFAGKAAFGIVQHRGESQATAFVLHPHLALDPGLPLGQKLGTTDQCYFRADRPDRFTQDPYKDHFLVSNAAGVGVTAELQNSAAATLATASGTQVELTLDRVFGQETIFLVLSRANVGDVQFAVTWDSPLSFLALDESFRLHVDDETGPDWPGADELDLWVDVDGKNVYLDSWDDADADEDWPGLVDSVLASVQKKTANSFRWVAFTGAVGIEVIKTDGIFAHGSAAGMLLALARRDGDHETRTTAITVIDPIGDGHLTGRGELSKFPPF
jgi:hypothetical protein